MADLLLEVEQMRSAVINAADAIDNAQGVAREKCCRQPSTPPAMGALVAEESIQMHGGIGMTWELPLAHYAKRLVLIDHQFGDEDHHLERFMALSQQAEACAYKPAFSAPQPGRAPPGVQAGRCLLSLHTETRT
jgi:alkylation response protein AidB-like acyl-CoA dehydrogenase